jgi:hypothetical protein
MSTPQADDLFGRYRDQIATLPRGALTRDVLLDGRFRLHQGAGFAVHYAPFDHVNRRARIVLVGLTPGWQQMRLAFETARDQLRAGADEERTLWTVKQQASFAGMRSRLVQWLDGIGVGAALGLTTAGELFDARAELLHTTSVVRYPVLTGTDLGNWSGGRPAISEPALSGIVRDALAPELAAIGDALVVPLGVTVEKGLRALAAGGQLDPARSLFGFPHPSGLNAQGLGRYREQQPRLRRQVASWAGERASATPTRATAHARPSPQRLELRDATRAEPPSLATTLPGRPILQGLMLDALDALGGRAQRKAIKHRAIKLGHFSDDQLRLAPPPSKTRQYPSLLAYELDWALNALHRQGRVRRLGPGEWARG